MTLKRRVALGAPRYLTPAFVQKMSGTSGTLSASVTLTSTPIAGNVLIAVFRSGGGTADRGNHVGPTGWIKAIDKGRGTSNPQMSIWWKLAGASEPTSIQFSDAGATACDLDVLEYSNVHPINPVDASDSIDGGAGTLTALTVAAAVITTTAPCVVIASIGQSNTVTWGNTWTNSFAQQTNQSRLSTAALIASAAGTFQTAESWTTARNAVGLIAAFRARPG